MNCRLYFSGIYMKCSYISLHRRVRFSFGQGGCLLLWVCHLTCYYLSRLKMPINVFITLFSTTPVSRYTLFIKQSNWIDHFPCFSFIFLRLYVTEGRNCASRGVYTEKQSHLSLGSESTWQALKEISLLFFFFFQHNPGGARDCSVAGALALSRSVRLKWLGFVHRNNWQNTNWRAWELSALR